MNCLKLVASIFPPFLSEPGVIQITAEVHRDADPHAELVQCPEPPINKDKAGQQSEETEEEVQEEVHNYTKEELKKKRDAEEKKEREKERKGKEYIHNAKKNEGANNRMEYGVVDAT